MTLRSSKLILLLFYKIASADSTPFLLLTSIHNDNPLIMIFTLVLLYQLVVWNNAFELLGIAIFVIL